MSKLDRGFGAKVRALRRREGLTQARMAERLSISPSYLNLIEHDKRRLSAALLIKIAGAFDIDLQQFSIDSDTSLTSDLMEAFSDPVFEDHSLTNGDIQDLVRTSPAVSRAVLSLYTHFREGQQSLQILSEKLLDHENFSPGSSALPSEEVTALIQQARNHFPELEANAEQLWRTAGLNSNHIYSGLVRYLEQDLGVRVKVVKSRVGGAVRRYDPKTHELRLSEVMAPRTRHFQVAHQIALLTQASVFDQILANPTLSTDDSRKLGRMVLANYFAGAVLMPYTPFFQAAEKERYDVELLGHRFRTSFEQVCHRLSTLQRPGQEGVPLHLIKIDPAGNISKRFSASGIRFARFGGSCPRWNVSRAFLTPSHIRIQISQMHSGEPYFCIAKIVERRHGGFRAPETVYAIGLGTRLEHAHRMVYSDGFDLSHPQHIVPIGITCRSCEQLDCDQRAFPSLHQPLQLDENARGIGFYSVVSAEE